MPGELASIWRTCGVVLALDHVGKGVRVAAGDDPDRPVFCAGGSANTSTARRSSSLVPPQTPWTWCVASAYCRHSRRTGQRAQTAFACSICCSAGPEGAMGKNRSGSQPRQAARDSQSAELASVAVPAGTEITGSVSLIDCWCASREAPARREWWCSQRRGVAGVARQPDVPVQQTTGCWQQAQHLGADLGAGGGEGPRERARCGPAADGPSDRAEFVLRHDLADQRQRVGLLMGEVAG